MASRIPLYLDFANGEIHTFEAGDTINTTYATNVGGGSGVSDGDKGDITVSGAGTVWEIDAGAVGNTEIASGVDAAKIADGTVSNTEYQYLNGVTSGIQSQIDGKAASVHTHAATDITSGTVAPARLGSGTADSTTFLRGDSTWAAPTAVVADGDKGDIVITGGVWTIDEGVVDDTKLAGNINAALIADGTVSSTEFQYLNGVTSSIQTQLDNRMVKTLVATLASDQATGANTTPVTLTGLVFSYEANSRYRIWAMGQVSPAAATTGCGFQFDLSSAVTEISVQFFHQLANTGTLSGGHSIADDASVGVSSGLPGTSTYPVTVHGLLRTGANTGTAQLRFRAEVAAVITCKAGFTLVVEKIG